MKRREEVTKSYCEIGALVGRHLKAQPYDCFCSCRLNDDQWFQYDEKILDFIWQAVGEKIKREER